MPNGQTFNALSLIGRRAVGWIWLGCLALVVAACQTQPPHTAQAPSLAERQVAGLRALGFESSRDDWLLDLPDPVSFKFGQSSVGAKARRDVATVAAQLKRLSINNVRVEGHSDDRGPDAVNLQLSQLRADAVAAIFVANGFIDADVVRHALGASVPVADNGTVQGRARNRRVEIIVPATALATP